MSELSEYFQFPKNARAYAIIWLHGLGASGEDMQLISNMMDLEGVFVRHLFLTAEERPITLNQGLVMPAWYDITGTTLNDREDESGINASREVIEAVIETVKHSGFKSEQIILAGFSQGAAMALYTGLQYHSRLGGIVALSGYLPLMTKIKPTLPIGTPFFIGYGRYDSLVMPAWSQRSAEVLQEIGYQKITVKDYPMEHCVCPDEIDALSSWVKAL